MKKKFLSLFMLLCVVFGCAFGGVACDDTPDSSSPSSSVEDPNAPLFSPNFEVDYAAKVTLDMAATTTKKKEVTVKTFIDGDTTHFAIEDTSGMPELVQERKVLKARYAAVNTPESTGSIEKWGKDASDFTKSKLQGATSIILETDGADWTPDSTGDRFLVWIWYKNEGDTAYRNLNIELLQYGLALPSKTDDVRYSEECLGAITQAKAEKLYLYSNKKDPDFYIGEAIPLTLKELRTNIEAYNGKRVAFEGVIVADYSNSVYVEEYDEETGTYYGMQGYYGFNPVTANALKVGYRMRMVGVVSYYETGGTYQISDLQYDRRDQNNPNNIKRLDDKTYEPSYTELTYATFASNVKLNIETETIDPDTSEVTTTTTEKTFAFANLAMDTSVSMKNLKVVKTYTTDNGGDSDGAISITCQDESGNQLTVRTGVFQDENGNVISADIFKNKTIDVKGIVGYFSGNYQIRVFSLGNITIHE